MRKIITEIALGTVVALATQVLAPIAAAKLLTALVV